MPALPAVPNVIKVVLTLADATDNNVESRFYLKYSGTPPTAAGLNAFCTTIATGWNTVLAALYHADWTLTSVTATDLSSSSAATGSAAVSHAGTRSGSPLSAGVAFLINFKIGRRYRGGKPRLYQPMGVSGDLLNLNTWSVAFTASVQSDWSSYITGALADLPSGTTGVAQVNVGYYAGFTAVLNPVTGRTKDVSKILAVPNVDTVTSLAASNIVASQRRRNLQKR